MKNRNTLFASLVIALFFIAIPQAYAGKWYVKTTGNDANSGNSELSAKQTIQAMVSSGTVNPGDTILVWGGVYTEQVVLGNVGITILGSQGGSRTTIQPPLWSSMQTYELATPLNWNGAGKLSSKFLRPILFVNASSSSVETNIKGITIDGSNADMTDASTQIFAGLVYRFASGVIGGPGAEYVEVKNIAPTDANTSSLNNTVGVLFLTRAKPTMHFARISNYRNIGIGIIGENTSGISSIGANQPEPTITDCIVTGDNDGSSSTSTDVIQSGVLIANGGRGLLHRNHIHGNRSTSASGNRFAYGIYLYNARNTLIGDNTSVKSNGNIVADNEIGLYVRITVNSILPSAYVIRQNNFVYNGGSGSGLGLASGKIARYNLATSNFTTDGAVRFSHSASSSQYLTLTNNAWGNAEAHLFFSQSASGYSASSYSTTPVALWRETVGDFINITSPLSPIHTASISVNNSHRGSNSSGIPSVDVDYGYSNFDQLNRAVYAAAIATATAPSPMTTIGTAPVINVENNVVENESVVITKPIRIIGSGGTCSAYPSITLKNGLNEPTIWFYGLSTADSDAFDRQPTRAFVEKIRIEANDIQTSGGLTDGPAFLFTGGTAGINSPGHPSISANRPIITNVAISNEFEGTINNEPSAFSTSQTGTSSASMRYAAVGAGPYFALYTKYTDGCDVVVRGNSAIDYYDNNGFAEIILENTVTANSCSDLQTKINNHSTSTLLTIVMVASVNCTHSTTPIYVNNTNPIHVDVQSSYTADIDWLINPGNGPSFGGGTNNVCSFSARATYGGTMNSNRVTIYPPACLQVGTDLVSSGSTTLLVAADGNTSGPLSFTDATVSIAKKFDFAGASRSDAHQSIFTAGNATLDGTFSLNSNPENTDIRRVNGSLTSINGLNFGDNDSQVDLNFSATGLPNFGGTAIEMSLQLIGNSGSRRLELTQSSYSAEIPTINKRVYINGLPNRGTVVAGGGGAGDWLILNGSGDCNNPSVLRNLSLNKIFMPNTSDCIQTALGIADCSVYTQNLEGVGTNATNGSGGIIDLNAQPFDNQHIDIAKPVDFGWANNSGNNNTITLRRGANFTGLNNWAISVTMEQCSTFVGASNPNVQQAVNSVKAAGTITIQGYGISNPLGSGTDPNGVWQFNNISLNKALTLNGTNNGSKVSSCASTGSSIQSNETVIGGNTSGAAYSTSNPIFLINSNDVTISGIAFANINATSNQYAIKNDGAFTDVTISNNILAGTSTSMPGMIDAASAAGTKQDWIITGNYVSASNIGSPAALIHFDNGTANAATTRIYDNKIDMNNQSNIDGIAVGNINNTAASLSNIENYPASSYLNIDENHISNIHNDSRGIRLEGAVNGINGVVVRRNTIIGDATMAAKTGNGVAIDVRLTASGSTGSNRINIRNNYINYCNNGVYMYHGTLVNDGVHYFNPSNLTIDSNNIANNTNGVHIDEIKGYMWNEWDFRFNWWGSVVGPSIIGTRTDLTNSNVQGWSSTSSTYQPFTPSAGVSNLRTSNFWTSSPYSYNLNTLSIRLIPEAISENDRSGSCGWQPEFLMGPVLRVNNAQNEILSMHYSVTDARNGDNNYPNSSTPIISTPGVRSNNDKIWVLGKDRFQSVSPLNLRNPNGYPMSSYPEATYPVVFGNVSSPELESQPSAVIGRLDPLYPVPASGTGAIKVASDFPKGFEINRLDIESEATGTVTVFEYNNGTSAFSTMSGGQNSIQNNDIQNRANVTDFTGVLVNSNSSNAIITNNNTMSNTTSNQPITSRGIVINSVGLDVSNNKSAQVTVSGNNINMAATGSSAGIYLNLENASGSTVSSNSVTGVSVTSSDIPSSSYLGNAIHIILPQNLYMTFNSVTGGNNTSPTRFGNGIVIDRPLSNCRIGERPSFVYSPSWTPPSNYSYGRNSVTSTFLQETSSTPLFGYGIKVFSSTGTGNTNGIIIDNNRIGSTSAAPASAGILLAGFDGTANATILRNVIIGVNNTNSGGTLNGAALKIFTSTLAGQPTSGTITIDSNVIGNNQLNGGNTLGLAIGTNESGVIRNSNADNLTVNVTNNYFRSHAQTVGIGTIEVADGRPNAGQNIRTMFTNGNNTFSYGAILTGENAPGDYLTATSRTAIAQPFNVNEPVKISRLIATPLNATTSDVSNNTVEVAPNSYRIQYATGPGAGNDAIEPGSNSDAYNAALSRHFYAEQLSAGNKRILMNGPSSATLPARILAGSSGTDVAFTSTERENKDIRGNIQFHAIGTGFYGEVPLGAANKGDIYLQRTAVAPDNGVVTFWYDASTLGSQAQISGSANSTAKATDIKAGLDDADDDNFAGSGSSTDSRRRTGVFVAGNGTSFTKDNTNEAITGTNVLNVYPNPASGDVTVSFRIPVEGIVRVALYNALGEKVTDLREEYLLVDNYTTSFSGANLPSGTYHVRLVHDLFTRTTPVSIIK